MKLRLPLALLVAWALACGGGEEEAPTTPPPPEPPTEVTPPVPPPPPTDGTAVTPPPPPTDGTAVTPPPTDGTAVTPPPTDGTAVADGTVEEGPTETKEEGTTKVETKSLKTSASVPVGQRHTLNEVARRQLQKRATELGYSKITNFNMGEARCNDRNCTASATATASRTVTVKEEEKSGQ